MALLEVLGVEWAVSVLLRGNGRYKDYAGNVVRYSAQ